MLTKIRPVFLPAVTLPLAMALAPPTAMADEWKFTDVSAAAGIEYAHGFGEPPTGGPRLMNAGVAAGDYDNDGLVDLYMVRGMLGPNVLFRNRGDGTFEERAAAAGVDLVAGVSSGPVFVDLDGDGYLDLMVGGIESTPVVVFRNRGDSTFEDVSDQTGLPIFVNTYGPAFGDYDRDGDLDLFMPQRNANQTDMLFRNDGGFAFTSVTAEAFAEDARQALTLTFTPTFTDVDFDGWPDLLVASDFDRSQVLLNNGPDEMGRVSFRLATDDSVIIDRFGMGAAVGDFDNDGHLDWFVTSIKGPDTIPIGNRLYRGLGDGSFEDVTEAAGVDYGYWGWGTCFADFDNDGFLDLFHVNGFYDPWTDDLSRLFMNNGDGSFSEESAARGLVDTRQGRGVVCFDYDLDGDLDIFIANNSDLPRLYRNDGGNQQHSLSVRLEGDAANTAGIGSRLLLDTGSSVLTREIRLGSNFVSQNPALAHFGLAAADSARELLVVWPGGKTSAVLGVPAGGQLVIPENLISRGDFETGDLAGWTVTSP